MSGFLPLFPRWHPERKDLGGSDCCCDTDRKQNNDVAERDVDAVAGHLGVCDAVADAVEAGAAIDG